MATTTLGVIMEDGAEMVGVEVTATGGAGQITIGATMHMPMHQGQEDLHVLWITQEVQILVRHRHNAHTVVQAIRKYRAVVPLHGRLAKHN